MGQYSDMFSKAGYTHREQVTSDRWAYDSAYDSDFRFSLGRKYSYVSDYDSDSDSVAS